MRPSEWAVQRISILANHFPLVWVEDPYRLVDRDSLEALRGQIAGRGYNLVHASNAFHLRLALDAHEPGGARLVVVDQSYTPREPHLLPRDTKPGDLRPLPAPDWKPLLPREAVFRPTIRDFLANVTQDEHWPPEINIYPYEELARQRPEDLVRAYQTFRRMGSPVTSEDLVLLGASAVFGSDLLDISDPLRPLQVAFHDGDAWARVATYFNPAEVETIRRKLQDLPRPYGDLFGPRKDDARMALVALVVFRQHMETPGELLPLLSPGLASFHDCTVPLVREAPAWFTQKDVPDFEKMLTPNVLKTLRGRLSLDKPENKRQLVRSERFSGRLKGMAPFEQDAPDGKSETRVMDGGMRLERLIPRFMETVRSLKQIVDAAGPRIDRLPLVAPKDLRFPLFREIFIDTGLFRVESILGRLRNLILDIEGPAKKQWDQDPDFQKRWKVEAVQARDLMLYAQRLFRDLDFRFGTMLEKQYSRMLEAKDVLAVDSFYDQFIGPRRRGAEGKIKKALILVFDGLRYDLWRLCVRPFLEREYAVEEIVGVSRLPSETGYSRRAFFAGKPPATAPTAGSETALFASCLAQFHKTAVEFTMTPPQNLRPGQLFHNVSKDQRTGVTVFNFADNIAHDVDWDIHTIQKVLEPLLQQVLSVLQTAGPDTLVFVTSDHGQSLMEGGNPIVITGSENVGYRSALVQQPLTGLDASHVFQIPAQELGHAGSDWFVFPRPGFYLRRADRGRGNVGKGHHHGGLSLFEVIVPMACLKHRDSPADVRLGLNLRGNLVAGQPGTIEVSLSTEGIISSPVQLVPDTDELEPAGVTEVSNVPKSVPLRYTPNAPGRRAVRVKAILADRMVGEASLDVEVAPAPAVVDETRAKLNKLFGE